MAKVIKNKNITICRGCHSYIEYDDKDITEVERSYGVQSYAGETYMAKMIVCPNCNRKIEVN